MPLLTWDAALDIGVAAMNAEHRDLIAAMNRIYEAHEQKVAGAPINQLVAELGRVCTDHFADEERYMASIAYPDPARHQKIHEQLLKQFAAHANAIRARGGRADLEFFEFLKLWVVAHIKAIDIKYAQHAQAPRARRTA